MKINLFTKVIFVIAASFFFCCKNRPSQLLHKKWKAVDASQKDASGKLSWPEDKKLITDQNIVLEFKADGTYSMSAHNDESETGKYSLSADTKKISLTPTENTPPNTFIVRELTNNKLVLEISPVSTIIMAPYQ